MKFVTTAIVALAVIVYAVVGGVVFQLLEKDNETVLRHDVYRRLDSFLGVSTLRSNTVKISVHQLIFCGEFSVF